MTSGAGGLGYGVAYVKPLSRDSVGNKAASACIGYGYKGTVVGNAGCVYGAKVDGTVVDYWDT